MNRVVNAIAVTRAAVSISSCGDTSPMSTRRRGRACRRGSKTVWSRSTARPSAAWPPGRRSGIASPFNLPSPPQATMMAAEEALLEMRVRSEFAARTWNKPARVVVHARRSASGRHADEDTLLGARGSSPAGQRGRVDCRAASTAHRQAWLIVARSTQAHANCSARCRRRAASTHCKKEYLAIVYRTREGGSTAPPMDAPSRPRSARCASSIVWPRPPPARRS